MNEHIQISWNEHDDTDQGYFLLAISGLINQEVIFEAIKIATKYIENHQQNNQGVPMVQNADLVIDISGLNECHQLDISQMEMMGKISEATTLITGTIILAGTPQLYNVELVARVFMRVLKNLVLIRNTTGLLRGRPKDFIRDIDTVDEALETLYASELEK